VILFQDEVRVRCHVLAAAAMNFKTESESLLAQIEAF
jgi:hypothetical protein